MALLGIQILGICFALGMIYITFLHYKRRNFSKNGLLFWSIIWIIVFLITAFPSTLYGLMDELNITRTMDMIILGSFLFFAVIIFQLYVTVQKLESKLELLVRKNAIRNPKNPHS